MVDPDAVAVAKVLSKHNCQAMLDANAERVAYFKRRITERGESGTNMVIVLIDPGDVHGGPIADVLMPGQNWQAIRDRGEAPVARGLARREPITEMVAVFDIDAATKLRAKPDALFVVVVANRVAEAYEV
jgi:hypothetical protein